MIRYLLSKLLLIEAVLLLVPVSVAIYYQESNQVFIALFYDWHFSPSRWSRRFTETEKSTDLCQGRGLNCCPLLDFMVFLWRPPLCLFRTNPQRHRCLLWNQFWIYDYRSNYSERCFRSHSFPPLLAKFHPLDRRDGGTRLCTCHYGQCQE